MEYVFVVSQLKSAVALNFVMMKEIRHWLTCTLTFVMMKERRYCLALYFVMMKEREHWLTLLVKLIILRRLGEEVLLFSFIHVHPTSSDGWTARYRSNSSSVTCLAISIGWSWNKPTSCINSQSTFYTGNCFSQEFHMKLYYNYAFLWYNLSESYMRHNGYRTAVLSYIDTNKVSIIIPSWDQTDPCP